MMEDYTQYNVHTCYIWLECASNLLKLQLIVLCLATWPCFDIRSPKGNKGHAGCFNLFEVPACKSYSYTSSKQSLNRLIIIFGKVHAFP